MPQLIPFYFVNQAICALILISILLHVFSKNILPLYVRIYNIRSFLISLYNNK